jgi:hypothetical protein
MPDTSAPPALRTGTGAAAVITAAARIPVRFAGDGAGVEELSWGQREIWLTMLRQRSWLPIGGWSRLAPGTTLADVVGNVRWIMERYQPLRTRLRFDRDGRPLQCVADRGTIGLDVYDCPAGEDPEAYVVALDARDRARPYDFVEEWPARIGVVRHRGVPTHLSAVMTHLVTDGIGGQIFLAETADRRNAPPVTWMQPLEQARRQGTPAGHRQSAAALRHWERALRLLPPPKQALVPRSGMGGAGWEPPATPSRSGAGQKQPRYHRGEFRSTALPMAVHVISERADIDSSQVLMTLLALALTGGRPGGRPAVIRPMVGNRFRSGFAGVVAMVAQRGICAADLGGVPFAEALRRVGAAAMTAYKYAYCDPDGVEALTARVAATHGIDPEGGLWFNDRRVATRQGFTGALPTAADLRGAPAGGLRWTVAQDDPFDPLSVDVDEAGDALLLTVFTDAARVAPAAAGELVRTVETLAVQHAIEALESEDR